MQTLQSKFWSLLQKTDSNPTCPKSKGLRFGPNQTYPIDAFKHKSQQELLFAEFIEVLIMTSSVMCLCSGLIGTIFSIGRGWPMAVLIEAAGHYVDNGRTITVAVFFFFCGLLHIICALILFFCINYETKEYNVQKLVKSALGLCLISVVFLMILLVYVYTTDVYTEEDVAGSLKTTMSIKSQMAKRLEKTWDVLHNTFRCCGIYNASDWNGEPPLSCCQDPDGADNATCRYFESGCSKKLAFYIKETISFYHGLGWVNMSLSLMIIVFLIYLIIQCEPSKPIVPKTKDTTVLDMTASLTKILMDAGAMPPTRKKSLKEKVKNVFLQ